MRRPLLLLLGCALLAGCGGAGSAPGGTSRQTTASSPTSTDGSAALEAGVRDAVEQDHSLSVESLWTNRVPAHPAATAGPALLALRQSVAQRHRAGVRVRTLSQHLRILNIELAPSYTTATVTILDVERVLPSYSNGRPRGKAVAAHERARLQLHRIGSTDRFAVWKVTTL